jgi:light-regulated signal transduction histidine kinase (bacteriophytochrome)
MLRRRYGSKLDASGAELLTMLVISSQHLQQLIVDLYQYTQTGQSLAEKETMDCRALTDLAILHLNHAIDASGATIHLDSMPLVYGYPASFTLLMQNLIGNAIKYVAFNIHPHIHIKCTEYPDRWLFSVSDNGIGIEEAYYSQIFLPFKRLHNQDHYRGSGMGLAICKKIVKQHGGEIWVESNPGAGSHFHFTVPK